MTPQSRDWSRDWSHDLKSYSEPIRCHFHSDLLPSERNLVKTSDEICRFGAFPSAQIRCQKISEITAAVFPAKRDGNQCNIVEQ